MMRTRIGEGGSAILNSVTVIVAKKKLSACERRKQPTAPMRAEQVNVTVGPLGSIKLPLINCMSPKLKKNANPNKPSYLEFKSSSF